MSVTRPPTATAPTAPIELGAPPVDAAALRSALDAAVRDGVITREQARAVLDRAAAAPTPPAREHRVRAVLAEVLGYVGGLLATVSAIILASQFWADLVPVARVALLALAAGALLAAGWSLHGDDRTAGGRLGSFLLALSTAAVAFAAVVTTTELLDLPTRVASPVSAWTTAGYAALVWRLQPRALAHIATFVALVAGVVTTVLAIDDTFLVGAGLAMWGVGVAWLLLATGGVVTPVGVGQLAGGVAALYGPLLGAEHRWPLLLGLATAAVLVPSGLALRRPPLTVLGMAGMVMYLPAVVVTYFAGRVAAPIALFASGVVLVGLGLGLARSRAGGRGG